VFALGFGLVIHNAASLFGCFIEHEKADDEYSSILTIKMFS